MQHLITTIIFNLLLASCTAQVVSRHQFIPTTELQQRELTYASVSTANGLTLLANKLGVPEGLRSLVGGAKQTELTAVVTEPIDDGVTRPAVVYLHGGAYLPGFSAHTDALGNYLATELARRGYRFISLSYRTVDQALLNFTDAGYLAVQDARAGFQFVVQHATTLNVDPTRVVLMGHSAGAISVLHAAYLDNHEVALLNASVAASLEDLYGDLDASCATVDPHISPAAVISLAGGVVSLGIIDRAESVPLYLVHGQHDEVIASDCRAPITSTPSATTDGTSAQPPGTPVDDQGGLSQLLSLPVLCGSAAISAHCRRMGLEVQYTEVAGGHNFILSASETPTSEGRRVTQLLADYLYDITTR